MGNIEDAQLQNARVGYQTAINILCSVGQINWSMMNSMILAHSILIGAIILCLTSQCNLNIFASVLSFTGLIICICWFLITYRGFKTQLYWVLSARELEEQYLSDPVNTISRGGKFKDGEQVSLTIKKCGDSKQIPIKIWPNIKTKHLALVVIIVFSILYISILFSVTLAPIVRKLICNIS